MRPIVVLALAAIGGPVAVAAAAPAPPSNDGRAAATAVPVPASVGGNTTGATTEPGEAASCGGTKSSLWYAFTATAERTALRLQADGDADATVAVFTSVRSRTTLVTCERTDDTGEASMGIRTTPGARYLVRVAMEDQSPDGAFRLSVWVPRPAAPFPGRRLRARGVSGVLDQLGRPREGYHMRLRAGVTYRVALSQTDVREGRSPGCVTLAMLTPSTEDYDESPELTARCNGYGLVTPTPEQQGRWVFRLDAPTGIAPVRYRLRVAPAGRRDMVPGTDIASRGLATGTLDGTSVNQRHVYRLRVTRRSTLSIALSAPETIMVDVVTPTGRVAGAATAGTANETAVRPGTYYLMVNVRAGEDGGRYRMRPVVRSITSTRLGATGTALSATVAGATSGTVRFTVERFQPGEGWMFSRRLTAAVGGSSVASAPWSAPAAGRYRARAEFLGSHDAAPSESGWRLVRNDG